MSTFWTRRRGLQEYKMADENSNDEDEDDELSLDTQVVSSLGMASPLALGMF